MTALAYTTVDSPIGRLLLVGDGDALCGLSMQDGPRPQRIAAEWVPDSVPFAEVRSQLAAFFAGERTAFDVPLRMAGTPFERAVWAQLRTIPYGETATYGEIAVAVGQPTAARAVGLANGRNPIAVIVPCHRVIGADGSLTGFAGGMERKRTLLDLESGRQTLR